MYPGAVDEARVKCARCTQAPEEVSEVNCNASCAQSPWVATEAKRQAPCTQSSWESTEVKRPEGTTTERGKEHEEGHAPGQAEKLCIPDYEPDRDQDADVPSIDVQGHVPNSVANVTDGIIKFPSTMGMVEEVHELINMFGAAAPNNIHTRVQEEGSQQSAKESVAPSPQ